MRINFNSELDLLNKDLIHMGNLIEASIRMSVDALEDRNIETAKIVIENDIEVNNMERVIERRSLNLLLKEQPMASDLRFISSSLKIITDMERIGDKASDIAKIVISMGEKALFKEPKIISKMAHLSIQMVNMSLDAFVNNDLSLVREVIDTDLEVNHCFEAVKDELIGFLRKNEGDEEQIIDFLMISKHLEKIGDHAKNIAGWVYFAIEGSHYIR